MWTMDGVKCVEVVDTRTVKITLKKPSHVFSWLMAMPFTGVVAEDGSGSGAYWLKSWRKNHEMVFARNESYREPVAIDEIRFPVVDDVSTQWLMFLGGELDFLGAVSRDNWDAVVGKDGNLLPQLKEKGMTLMSSSSLSVFYVGFNMNDPVVGPNKKLRQALNCAFDFPAWKRFLNNRILPSDGPLPPGILGKLDTPFPYAYNEDKAKALLVDAGYPKGVDPKTGRRLHLEIAVGRATQDAREMVELMASFYDRVGIELVARYMTWDAFLTAVNEGRTQMFNLGWIGDYPDPENFLQLFHSKNVSPGANHSNYINPEFDRAYDAMDWKTAQEIIREDCPWIFLYCPKSYSLMWNRVKNYIPTDFPYGIEKHLHLKD
jgi:ABC-type transport system substrate-binding protein